MSLIASRRHRAGDLAAWATRERGDRIWAQLPRLARLVERAKAALRTFAAGGDFYVGTSWGKDSLVVVDLAREAGVSAPVVWFPAGPVENPDCALVRDAYLARHDVRYVEHEAADLVWRQDGTYLVHDGAQAAFVRASRSHGLRYASGVRAEESTTRRRRVAQWGECSPHTCAPIGHWRGEDVFAYLALRDLPVHPAYACSRGGSLQRSAIRVGTIGGAVGDGWGRHEWEERYYPEVVRVVRQLASVGGVGEKRHTLDRGGACSD